MKQLQIVLVALCITTSIPAAKWKPVEIPIMTRWGQTVTPENAWTEYPRPQLKRTEWQNLNGLWDFAVTAHDTGRPRVPEGKILVPYPIDTALSGVRRQIEVEEDIWYRRTFEIPAHWKNQRVRLHFEAVDWRATVRVNRREVGTHEGGYAPFSFDITDALQETGPQTVVVKVWDPQDTIFKSLGKQANREEQYDRCSGIWQTIWLEPVPETSVSSLKITPSAEGMVEIVPTIEGTIDGLTIRYEALASGQSVLTKELPASSTANLKISNPQLWSPESPFLYDLKVTLLREGERIDEVESYFGLRTIALQDSAHGKQMALNGKPIFQMGPLDQNYWPGGGLTPPSDEAMIWECQYLKDIGCNMVRLHIKENPQRWYYHCDRLGLLVWQDFISAVKGQRNDQVSREESDQWMAEQEAMLDTLYNHPSIIKWIVFNEAWGQHDTKRILKWTQDKDSSRIISVASGWYDLPGASDIRDIHDYSFYPAIPALGTDPSRAVILGECGGFAGAVPPHNWTGRSNTTGEPENLLHGGFDPSVPRDDNRVHDIFRPTFSYGEPFEKQYSQFIDSLVLLKNNGLTAAIYTQMTDMKLEENGWLTFDRKVSKIDVEALRAIHERLYKAPPKQKTILDNSWKIAFGTQKNDKWTKPDFNDASWKEGEAPFGYNSILKSPTEWKGGNLYLRKSFTVDSVPSRLSFRLTSYLDGPNRSEWIYTKIYINGEYVQDDQARQFMPEQRVADIPLWPETTAKLKSGANTIAVEVVPGFSGRSGKIEGTVSNMNGLAFDFNLMEVED